MRKNLKIIVPIASVIVVIVAFWMLFDIKNKVEEVNYGTNDIKVNEVVDFDDEEENVVEEQNIVEEEVTNTVENTIEATNTIEEELSNDDDAYSKSKLDEAKSLVQKAWGEDDSVYFTNEGINSDGLYMVAARDKMSTAVKNYFKVNLENKKVQVDY